MAPSNLTTVLFFIFPTHSNPSIIHIQRVVKTLNILWGLQECRKIITFNNGILCSKNCLG